MASPIIEDIAERVRKGEARLAELKELVLLAERANEDVSGFNADIALLSQRIENWKRALSQSGYEV